MQPEVTGRVPSVFHVRSKGLVALLVSAMSQIGMAQPPPMQPGAVLTIPYLANATRPSDLDFAAAQCDVEADGRQMTCRFRQVFVTQTSFDPTACVLTTNGYERTFRATTSTQWVSETPPDGECGIVETTTLEDGGGTRWTMTIRKSAPSAAGTHCQAQAAATTEVYDWRGVRRALPCRSIQPGAIER
jgi:hypothetical protein